MQLLCPLYDLSAFVAVGASQMVIPSNVNFKSTIVTSVVTVAFAPSSRFSIMLLLLCLFSSGVVVGIEDDERLRLLGVW